MTSRPITNFTEATDILNTDYLPIVRVNESNVDDRNKKITYSNLIKNIPSSVDFVVTSTCTSNCTLGGKAFTFYAPQTQIDLNVVIGFEMSTQITTATKAIQVVRWNQAPNTSLIGREWYKDLPQTGGKFSLTIDSTYRWISIFAKHISNSNYYDGVCFNITGNTITLLSF